MSDTPTTETAIFAGGCFWCTEAIFKSLRGVISVTPGYTGGVKKDPKYDDVATGRTGHAEAIRIEYDPSAMSYDDLLTVFFHTHDPTTLNRQGADIGTQYRSAIFYVNEAQKISAEALIRELVEAKAYDAPIVTEVLPLQEFFPAEDSHRDYYALNPAEPYCKIVIAPKLEKLRERFEELVKTD